MSEEPGTTATATDNTATATAADSTTTPFHASLPDDLRGHEALKDIADAPALAKAFIDLKSSTPQVPEAYAYDFGDMADKVDKAAIEQFSTAAKELGLTQAQYEKIVAFDLDRARRYESQFTEAVAEAKKQAEAKLRETWKADFDRNTETASKGLRAVIRSLGDAGLEARLKNKGFLDDPDVMMMFHKIGATASEDAYVPSGRTTADIPRGLDGLPILSYNS